MVLLKKTTSQLQTQEDDIHTALKAWYLTPGIQRDLRNKENGAVQTVLEILERRRVAAVMSHHSAEPACAPSGLITPRGNSS